MSTGFTKLSLAGVLLAILGACGTVSYEEHAAWNADCDAAMAAGGQCDYSSRPGCGLFDPYNPRFEKPSLWMAGMYGNDPLNSAPDPDCHLR